MKFQSKILIVFSIVLVMAGCKKNYVLNNKQHILFQYEYISYARDYVHEGFFIDDEGNIMTYKNPEGWNFHDQNYNLTESQLDENISRCTKSDIKIGKEELARFSSHIDNIASSKVTAIKKVAADAGKSVFICYDFEEENSLHKGFLIKMEGDFNCENLNFYSKKVSLWLKGINSSLSKK
ncbi:MAG: hypothetical protein A2X05_17705 [Bacteroidetes bacterium GWE2_41_25]|nr:MAG: hypothetical protein A2X03_17780 [Bacteroidetes bacterium GWA2_40_15]OFY02743.1 MAG: hypothetical protein A2X05_17705 [Bacteroidetes bacterium GWE2_41_25]OFY60222.1 MAG: hypothetical protein A2X04_05605 [Bacteroidetes bacterium GWF2_41_9]HAM09996.1 hypothetical protein [Bacteroidales bacterium]HBH85040.1 hypothetical protein [Bacteroidales bacterium]